MGVLLRGDSHGTLVITGNAAKIKVQETERVVWFCNGKCRRAVCQLCVNRSQYVDGWRFGSKTADSYRDTTGGFPSYNPGIVFQELIGANW